MTFFEPDEERWDEATDALEETAAQRWPLGWQGLYPRERWIWFEQLWTDVCMLSDRYRLPVGWRWWRDQLKVEALAAISAWVARYDDGEWDDPPGKLAFLCELERVSALLGDEGKRFSADRDRPAFIEYLRHIGCRPPGR